MRCYNPGGSDDGDDDDELGAIHDIDDGDIDDLTKLYGAEMITHARPCSLLARPN